jgi:hypothetical protein
MASRRSPLLHLPQYMDNLTLNVNSINLIVIIVNSEQGSTEPLAQSHIRFGQRTLAISPRICDMKYVNALKCFGRLYRNSGESWEIPWGRVTSRTPLPVW